MKWSTLVLTIILLLSLVMTATASAAMKPELPKWEEVFNPTPFPFPGWWAADDTALKFKGQLYFKFFGDYIYDQAWVTPDGENWSLAWEGPTIDPEFEYFWPMIIFENQLYLVLRDGDGMYPDRIVRTPDGVSWETVFSAEGNENLWVWFGRFMSFNDHLFIFAGNWDGTNYSEHLWRSPSGDPGTWEDVDQFSCTMRAYATFKDALYMGGEWCEGGVQIWRSYDGAIFEPVTTNGFEIPSNLTVEDIGEKGGYLYASLTNEEGGQIWRTRNGMDWQPVTTDGLGDPNNFSFTLINYKENVYAFSESYIGVQVYRSQDGIIWEAANEPGWGDPENIFVAESAMLVYKGALYVSPDGPAGILRFIEP